MSTYDTLWPIHVLTNMFSSTLYSNSNYNNNYNQGNSYNNNDRNTVGGGSNGFQDPYNPYVNQDLGSRNGGQINNNFDSAPSTKAVSKF